MIKSPTGTGKTIVALGLISAFSQETILILVHTRELLYQTEEELYKWGFSDIGMIGDGKKTTGRIQIAMIQSFVKLSS